LQIEKGEKKLELMTSEKFIGSSMSYQPSCKKNRVIV
jgi:hypothetical protein